MPPTTIRKAIGTVKDQASIGIAKVSSNVAPELEVAIVKATSHDDDPASEKYIREILHLNSLSRGYVNACVVAISRRLGKTRDWIVALKCLMLIHRLLNDGDAVFQQEIMYATRKGTRLLNLSDFRDEAHSNSWDHSAFVRTYALYLDQRLELMVYDRKQSGNGVDARGFGSREDLQNYRSPPGSNRGYDDFSEFRDRGGYGMPRSHSYGDVRESTETRKDVTPLREMKPERVLGKMGHLQRLLDRFLSCRPTGLAKSERMILVALYAMVKESFKFYADVCEVLAVLLDKFFDMEYEDCVKAFDAYAGAAKQIDELVGFYNWCKDVGVARSSEYPEVQKITIVQEEEPVSDLNEIKALPPPEDYTPPPPPAPDMPKPVVEETRDLVDLRDDGVNADSQGNTLALALFGGAPGTNNGNGSWEPFSSNGEPEVTSAWQNPASESGKADWELALVESASNLSKQKASMGGGLDPLLLNGMYDQGMVRQHVSTANLSGGSASSVALPGPGTSKTPVLALPAPDGTVQAVGQDPFAASLTIPPPAYVQMSDMEKKQHLLLQEQMVWQQYSREGMQGQTSLHKIGAAQPYGMPPVNGPYGYQYHYTPY
ncbi:clathrin assembly protein [Dorcoceras hygrometricum]|uniref:Clathrin assembly protein n=1 Tax=Dorcoceras hygrometricum TaxID=472368 RepID=A0A2Z7CSD4_9LAMI|nr:clathrin assembly protein [Dorcoceras hygrometricum]